jgi:AcrR family transcriptional regulator
MPRSKEDNQKVRKDRMVEIKDATIRVYAAKGYLGTQMDDIAKEAGLAKGLLYYYFKSKPELFQYVFNELMEKASQNSKALVSEEKSLKQTLESFIYFLVSASFELPHYPLVYKMMSDDLDRVFPDNAAEMQQTFFNLFTRPLVEQFASAMDKGEIPQGNPTLQALLFIHGVLSISYLVASNPAVADGESQEQAIGKIKRQLFYGIFTQGE